MYIGPNRRVRVHNKYICAKSKRAYFTRFHDFAISRPRKKNHRVIRQNGRFSIFFFFFFSFAFFFFFPPLCTLVIHPVKYHGAKYVTRRFILRPRCNGTLGSRIAFVICTDEILRDSRNTKPFAPVSRKKGKKKKKKNSDPSTVETSRENRQNQG